MMALRSTAGVPVQDDADVLEQLAGEHRDLTTRSSDLRRDGDQQALRSLATAVAEHEIAHRLLVHPLLRRDERGLSLFEDRREEQLLLADRLGRALTAGGTDSRALGTFDREFASHTDREEILSFPHLRREVTPDELRELGDLRRRLRPICLAALEDDPRVVTHGRWATVPRHELPPLLGVPDELVEALPLATAGRTIDIREAPLQDVGHDGP
jgi:hypothetical protein